MHQFSKRLNAFNHNQIRVHKLRVFPTIKPPKNYYKLKSKIVKLSNQLSKHCASYTNPSWWIVFYLSLTKIILRKINLKYHRRILNNRVRKLLQPHRANRIIRAHKLQIHNIQNLLYPIRNPYQPLVPDAIFTRVQNQLFLLPLLLLIQILKIIALKRNVRNRNLIRNLNQLIKTLHKVHIFTMHKIHLPQIHK